MTDFTLIVFLCLITPTLLMTAFLEPKSRVIMGFMAVGTTIGLIASQINTVVLALCEENISASYNYVYYFVTTNLTPIIEELFKALPVLFFAVAISNRRENIVSVSFAVGLGFALFENCTMTLQNVSNLDILWIISRGFGAGLMHGLCTAAVGMGFSFATKRKSLALPATVALLVLAAIYHSIFNMLVQTDAVKYLGLFLPLITYIPMLIWYLKIRKLHPEF